MQSDHNTDMKESLSAADDKSDMKNVTARYFVSADVAETK